MVDILKWIHNLQENRLFNIAVTKIRYGKEAATI
jgi:hypothetical protein